MEFLSGRVHIIGAVVSVALLCQVTAAYCHLYTYAVCLKNRTPVTF